MQWLEDVLRRSWSSHRPAVEVLADGLVRRTLSYAELLSAAAALAADLTETVSHQQLRALVVAANSPEHIVADLATMIAGAATTAVPPDADEAEIRHIAADADIVLCDTDGRRVVDRLALARPVRTVDARQRPGVTVPELPGDADDARKVVVCLSVDREFALPCGAIDEVLRAVRLRAPTGVWRRYLAGTPLSTLTEQAFVYLTLQHQGTVRLTSSNTVNLADAEPTAALLTAPVAEALEAVLKRRPELDGEDLCRALFGGPTAPYLACFDPLAPTDELIARGVPVHRGFAAAGSYPLTLAAQGTPGHSVGEPLSHVWLKVADDGELMVKSKSQLIIPWRTAGDGWLGLGVRGNVDAAGLIHIG
jgi:long-chain acyl-CoA synthetase